MFPQNVHCECIRLASECWKTWRDPKRTSTKLSFVVALRCSLKRQRVHDYREGEVLHLYKGIRSIFHRRLVTVDGTMHIWSKFRKRNEHYEDVMLIFITIWRSIVRVGRSLKTTTLPTRRYSVCLQWIYRCQDRINNVHM